jgi:hypothetical protein
MLPRSLSENLILATRDYHGLWPRAGRMSTGCRSSAASRGIPTDS